jgi:ABC-type transporter Mla subunit MlaD
MSEAAPYHALDQAAFIQIAGAREAVVDAATLLQNLAHHRGELEFDPRGLALIAGALDNAARDIDRALNGAEADAEGAAG